MLFSGHSTSGLTAEETKNLPVSYGIHGKTINIESAVYFFINLIKLKPP